MSIAITNTDHYSNIADSVRYSKDAAAYESSLARAKAERDSIIDGSITSIESDAVSVRPYAFYYNRRIATISLKNATVMNGGAFMYCSVLSNIYIPLVATISGSAFQDCTSITSIFAPSVTRFGTGVFYGCRALSILILHQRTTLDNINSFQNCPAIIYVQPEDLSWYETATNWSTLYAQDRIKSIEDLTGDDLVWYQEQLARYQEVS